MQQVVSMFLWKFLQKLTWDNRLFIIDCLVPSISDYHFEICQRSEQTTAVTPRSQYGFKKPQKLPINKLKAFEHQHKNVLAREYLHKIETICEFMYNVHCTLRNWGTKSLDNVPLTKNKSNLHNSTNIYSKPWNKLEINT